MADTTTQKAFTDETAARHFLEASRWPDGAYCPFCGQYETVKALPAKGSMGAGWYHCRECRKKFTVRVGTLYERSHIPLHKWLYATHLLCASKKGMSAHQLHRLLGVTYKSAWFMAHRIREGMMDDAPPPMGGEGKFVEADETYIGGAKHGKNRKGVQYTLHDKMKVVSLVERGGKARSFHVDKINASTVRHILVTNAARTSHLRTDEGMQYRRVGKEYASHEAVHHAVKEYVRGDAHTNTIEGFFSIFKRGMKGTYQHCSEQHLQRYLTEFDFRYNNRSALGVEDVERAAKALKGITGKRLTYRRTDKAAHA